MAKARDKLTVKEIEAAKRGDKQKKMADGGGLWLLIEPGGRKWFRLDYRFEGRQQSLSLGTFGPEAVSLAEARDKADDLRRMVRGKTNPSKAAEKKTAKAADPEDGHTFKQAADGWRALIDKKPRADKTRDRDERMVGYLIKAFGNKPVGAVRKSDLIAVLNTFEKAESYETRMRLQQTAINVMNYAEGQDWLNDAPNPFATFKAGNAFTAPAAIARAAIVEAEPFGQLLRDVRSYAGRQGNLVGMALELIALTFVRPGTALGAEWSEFDLDADIPMWTIPFGRLKQRTFREGIRELKGKPHKVPLSRQAVALLRRLKKQTGEGKLLFPGRSGPLSTNAPEIALAKLGYKGIHCPHGFRSSASTMLNIAKKKQGGDEVPMFSAEAIEFQLEHVEKSVAATYNRDQRLPERIRIMQYWADLIDALRDPEANVPDNVVPMRA